MRSLAASLAAGRVCIVADVCQNHQGSVSRAKRLAYLAMRAGADVVKGQKRDEYPEHWRTMEYRGRYAFGPTYREHRDALELSWQEHRAIDCDCATLGVEYTVSAFDPTAVRNAVEWEMPWLKVPSALLSDGEMLDAYAATGLPLVLSTGMHLDVATERALTRLESHPAPVYVLHCVSAYPARAQDYDVAWIFQWARRQRRPLSGVGISLHVSGHDMPELLALVGAAVSGGACIVEAHITDDRDARGRDHQASLLPDEFAQLVRAVRAAEAFTRDGKKAICDSEREPMERLRRAKG